MNTQSSYYTYILQCSDQSYYVGSTQDIAQRMDIHNSGNGPRYTAARLPVKLLYSEQYDTLGEAVRRERQVKKWGRAKKEALIAQNKDELKRLSKRRR